eukprot:520309-Pyramimonas_sp.AAC.1
MDFLAAHLMPGEVEDDIVLEVVIFIGTLCSESTAPLIVQVRSHSTVTVQSHRTTSCSRWSSSLAPRWAVRWWLGRAGGEPVPANERQEGVQLMY